MRGIRRFVVAILVLVGTLTSTNTYGEGGNIRPDYERGNDERRNRPVAGDGDGAGIAPGHAELSAIVDAFERCAERAKRLGATGARQRPRDRKRTARGQQQLPD